MIHKYLVLASNNTKPYIFVWVNDFQSLLYGQKAIL